MDHHVSDIEHTYIKYREREPDRVGASIHTWGEEVSYGSGEVEKEDGHPVLYSSYGSHASYFGSGV
jgi:hypothetical protein